VTGVQTTPPVLPAVELEVPELELWVPVVPELADPEPEPVELEPLVEDAPVVEAALEPELELVDVEPLEVDPPLELLAVEVAAVAPQPQRPRRTVRTRAGRMGAEATT